MVNGHACTAASLGNKDGISVSGGFSSDSEYLSSVQFYTASEDTWEDLGDLLTKRSYHSMSLVGQNLVVAGGAPEILDSVETSSGDTWEEGHSLREERKLHAVLSIEDGMIDCLSF